MRIHWRPLLLQLLSHAVLGATPAIFGVIFGSFSMADFLSNSGFGFVYANCIGFPCRVIVPRVECRMENRTPALRFAAIIGTLLALGIAGFAVASALLIAAGAMDWRSLAHSAKWTLRVCLLLTLGFGLVVTLITTLQDRLAAANRAVLEGQLAAERASKIAAEARLASLESRVRPHFLFNTLNSIAALVRDNPSEAERMIERLSTLLRFSLDSEFSGLVPLSEELGVVRDYLEIEKVRFGNRLRFVLQIDPAAAHYKVPALSLQTLVENSVKYAAGKRREGAEIVVSARVMDGRLTVEVCDDGPGFELAASIKPGHGLDLLQNRLAALFGPSASLQTSARDGRTRIAMVTPDGHSLVT